MTLFQAHKLRAYNRIKWKYHNLEVCRNWKLFVVCLKLRINVHLERKTARRTSLGFIYSLVEIRIAYLMFIGPCIFVKTEE